MKKIIGAVFAAAVMTFGGIVCSAAKEDTTSTAKASATFCFDTDAGLSKWENFGSADTANLTMSISNDRKVSGSVIFQYPFRGQHVLILMGSEQTTNSRVNA